MQYPAILRPLSNLCSVLELSHRVQCHVHSLGAACGPSRSQCLASLSIHIAKSGVVHPILHPAERIQPKQAKPKIERQKDQRYQNATQTDKWFPSPLLPIVLHFTSQLLTHTLTRHRPQAEPLPHAAMGKKGLPEGVTKEQLVAELRAAIDGHPDHDGYTNPDVSTHTCTHACIRTHTHACTYHHSHTCPSTRAHAHRHP